MHDIQGAIQVDKINKGKTKILRNKSIKNGTECTGGEGGSSIVKVPGDVPPARVYFLALLV